MNLDLTGKRAIVCGSTQGIGKATAYELASLGADITLVARNADLMSKISAELPNKGDQFHEYLVADFTNPRDLEKTINEYVGSNDIAVLVNNTGGPAGGQAVEAEPDSYIHAFNMHLICNQILVQAVVPGMKKNGWGRIVNVISTSVKTPIKGLGVSNTIRGAVASWAKTLSLELAPYGITVNNVLPGFTRTGRLESIISSTAEKESKSIEQVEEEMIRTIPANRFGDSNEVAAAIAFLSGPSASYINGINLPVDGGRTPTL